MNSSESDKVRTNVIYSEDELKSLIKDSGTVRDSYGGFEIVVKDPSQFPWGDVLFKLLEISSDVWIRRENNKIKILTKPMCE